MKLSVVVVVFVVVVWPPRSFTLDFDGWGVGGGGGGGLLFHFILSKIVVRYPRNIVCVSRVHFLK